MGVLTHGSRWKPARPGRVALAASLAVALAASPARADAPAVERRSAARALANKGYEHYQQGRYAEAVETFRRADETFHAPTLAFALAKALAAAGRLREARDAYRRVVDELLPAAAPADYRRAQQSAAVELTAIAPRIPSLRVTVSGAEGRAITVTLDGAPVAPSALGERIEVDPGRHAARAAVAGAPAVAREVVVAEGAQVTVELPLAAPRPAAEAPPPRPAAPPPRGSLVPSIAVFGVGAAALAVGIGTGVDTLSRAAAIKAECRDGVCPLRLEPQASTARTEAAVATAAFVVAGAAVVAGVVLLVVRPGARAARQARSILPGPRGVEVRF